MYQYFIKENKLTRLAPTGFYSRPNIKTFMVLAQNEPWALKPDNSFKLF